MEKENGGLNRDPLLAIAVAVIAILSAVFVWPVCCRRYPKNHNRTACINNVKQITLAGAIYANDHHGRYPCYRRLGDVFGTGTSQSLGGTTEDAYVTNPRLYRCPMRGYESSCGFVDDGANNADYEDPAHCGYGFNTCGVTEAFPPNTPIASDMPDGGRGGSTNHGGKGLNVGFLDGHVEWVTPDEECDNAWWGSPERGRPDAPVGSSFMHSDFFASPRRATDMSGGLSAVMAYPGSTLCKDPGCPDPDEVVPADSSEAVPSVEAAPASVPAPAVPAPGE